MSFDIEAARVAAADYAASPMVFGAAKAAADALGPALDELAVTNTELRAQLVEQKRALQAEMIQLQRKARIRGYNAALGNVAEMVLGQTLPEPACDS